MAAEFKTATVNSSDVPSTQTDFPTYVDLARLGITTLAEAESVRVYADEAKTTEWAREIVSVTEMHVKVPSLTSTVDIYVDWDGVRADYAVSATYGRNAVWTGYTYVAHMEGNADNSTGGTNPTAVTAITFSTGNGLIGKGAGFNGSNSIITIDLAIPTSYSISYLGKGGTNQSRFLSKDNAGSQRNVAHEIFTSASPPLNFYVWNASNSIKIISHTAYVAATWFNYQTTWNSAGNFVAYADGSSLGTVPTGGNARNSSNLLAFGGESALSRFLNGAMDEIRVKPSVNSANWITTEYNNQNDEATFWGTWTDAGGGSTPAQAARRGVIMMM